MTLDVLKRTAYVLVFGGAIALIAVALDAGVDHDVVLVAAPLAAALVVLALERLIPYEVAWSKRQGDVVTDALHGVVSFGLVPAAYSASIAIGLVAAGEALSDAVGWSLWPSHWPLGAQGLLAVLIAELGYYISHRIGHALQWRLHATHHSAPRLYWLNVLRFHPLDALLQLVGHVGPLALLGAPASVLTLVVAATSVHGLLQHSNADLRLGWLNWIFAGPELHRWHHVKDDRAHHNYGQVLAVYDLLFGTRALPPERPPADVGLPHPFPSDYLGQLASPLRRRLFR